MWPRINNQKILDPVCKYLASNHIFRVVRLTQIGFSVIYLSIKYLFKERVFKDIAENICSMMDYLRIFIKGKNIERV